MAPSNSYTTSDLVTNVLLVSHMPTGNNTFTTSNIINLADRELQTSIISQILSSRGGYYLSYQDYASADDGLYAIPSDCIAGALENVEVIQDTGIIPVSLIEESEQFSTTSPTSTSYGFFLRGNYVQILPIPSVGLARLWYLKRPSRLISTTLAAQVTAINGAVISVSSLPSSFLVGSTIDILGDQPPFHIIGTNIISNITGTDVTLSSAVTGLSISDWLAPSKQTPIPQIPVEFRPLLEQRVVVKIYELQGMVEKMAMAQKKLQEMEKDTLSLISPRVKAKTKVITTSAGGFLSGGRGRWNIFPAGR